MRLGPSHWPPPASRRWPRSRRPGARHGGTVIGGTPFSGEIGIGVMGVMGSNPDEAGRYNGLNTTGIDVLGNFDLSGRAALGLRRNPVLSNSSATIWSSRPAISSAAASAPAPPATAPKLRRQQQPGERRLAGVQRRRSGHLGGRVYYNSITYTGNVIDSLYTRQRRQALLNTGLAAVGRRDRRHHGPPSPPSPSRRWQRPAPCSPSRPARGVTSSAATSSTSGATGPSPAPSATSTRKARWRSRSTGRTAGWRLPCRSTTTPTATMRRPPTPPACIRRSIQYTYLALHRQQQLRHPALSVREYGEALSAVGGLFDAAQQQRALRDDDAGDQCHTEHAHQSERARRRGKAGRHVPAEHRRSWRGRSPAAAPVSST